MNTGIQDVHNLAWKLRLVTEGEADERLLDTYETERRPVAQENADHSMQNALRMLEVFEALGVPFDLGADRAAAHASMRETLGDAAGRARASGPPSRASAITSTRSGCSSASPTTTAPSSPTGLRGPRSRIARATTSPARGPERGCRTRG
jgi:hypothetical protein